MGTNYYWNTTNELVLEELAHIGNWKTPIRIQKPLEPDKLEHLRLMGIPSHVLTSFETPVQPEYSLQELSHIGKRSGGGLYCYKCNSWLLDPANCDPRPIEERRSCSYCGEHAQNGRLDPAALVELGQRKSATGRPESGVQGTCVFTFAHWPDEVYRITLMASRMLPLVVNEYGDAMTGAEFTMMLRANVSITKLSIGDVFS